MNWLETLRRVGGDVAALRLQRRVARRTSADLVDWADASVAGIGRALNDWTQRGMQGGLDEARMGTAALLAVLEELDRRRAAGTL